MNQVHRAVVAHIREASSSQNAELGSRFTSMSDEQIVRRMFANYRGERGLRLTNFGLQIMRGYFRGYETSIPEDEPISPMHLVFLDDRVTMPYYLDIERRFMVVYDRILGIKLRLVDGRLSILLEIETE